MSVRDPGYLSRAHGAYSVVDNFLRGWRLMKKKKKAGGRGPRAQWERGQRGANCNCRVYRGTSLIKKHPPLRTAIGL